MWQTLLVWLRLRVHRAISILPAAMITGISAVVFSLAAWADNAVLSYAGTFGGSSYDEGHATVTDSSGNVYVTGYFEGAADGDPGPGVLNVSSSGRRDAIVVKLSPVGNLIWTVTMDGGDNIRSTAIEVDAVNNVYVAGTFFGDYDFDPGPGVFTLSSVTGVGGFVTKLDSAGVFQWAIALSGSGTLTTIDIAADSTGNVYATGGWGQTVDFDPGPGVMTMTSLSSSDAYVCKMNSGGSFQWARALRGSNRGEGTSIAVEDNTVYCTGFFRETVDFDPGPGVFNLTSAGQYDAYICKLDGAGGLLWAGAISGLEREVGTALAIDSSGGVLCAGQFNGTTDFDPGAGVFNVSSTDSSTDGFICKWSASGNLVWAGTIGGPDIDIVHAIAVDELGGVYATGEFGQTADFDPGPSSFELTGPGIRDVFVSKWDGSGALQWAVATGSIDTYDQGLGIAAADDGIAWVTGQFGSTADFEFGSGLLNITSAGDSDGFILKLEPQALPVAFDEIGETNADQLQSALSSPATNSVLTNDTDANTRRTLTVTAFDATSVLGATVVVNPDGTFVYDPTAVTVLQALIPGDSLVDSFTYTVSDGTDSAVGTATITVYGAGTMLPALAAWGVGLLSVVLAGAGVRACKSSKETRI